MLDTNFIRTRIDEVTQGVAKKGGIFDPERFTALDAERRRLIAAGDELKSRKKALAREIGALRAQKQDSAELERQGTVLSESIAAGEAALVAAETAFADFILTIPTLPHDSVPAGRTAEQNVVVREWGEKPVFSFPPRPHWEIGELSGGLDFTRAAKLSGSRFALYFGATARLERALIQLMLDVHTGENGYTEVLPPFLVNDLSLIGTGNLPKFKDDLFKVENFNLYLVPTAEVPLTNIHRDEVLEPEQLPRKYVAYTPCFRSEAGSHGKDVRGLVRQHQFNKVELLKFADPARSYEELESLTRDAEGILQRLGLHYRVVALCGGDMSFSSAKTYDIEVWMPARGAFMEISSCSNFESFQSRRARIKYRTAGGQKEFVHTLNGSGLAAGRTVAAVLENYQREDGQVVLPPPLRPFFAGRELL